ncbi:hypothetical protein P153DRAFT_11107 [Dothidotthia symphoricarpi CBS 119687]|uniref:NADH-ubiquinone oxidoreductase 9.5 kDa subunit n=1 Tax=Dothidotthia symphoricarpi CBS 119687 TaxID=1392245 RepID=A0A6A6ASD4_9PLEO|nr:uncharacterized protein P153DRAFT_11107 [Dothidotthia symphoricarpi CBS 119687]KAF2134859.1 hypothetical protein P153DRAFT_11107 [Dothidotthia symphoricarpi CBS 119687]
MSGIAPAPFFFKQPLRYLKWVSYNKPAYFYSVAIGCVGPVLVVAVPPIRRYMGDEKIAQIPMTYPVPKGARQKLTGYEDE